MVASAAGQCVGQTSEQVGQQILLQIPNARLWSPDDPFLYNLEISLVGPRNITYGTVLNTCATRYCDLFLHSIMHTVHNSVHTQPVSHQRGHIQPCERKRDAIYALFSDAFVLHARHKILEASWVFEISAELGSPVQA